MTDKSIVEDYWLSNMTHNRMLCACCRGDPLKMYFHKIKKIKANWHEGELELQPEYDRGVIQYDLDGSKWYCPDCVKKMKEKNINNMIDGLL